MLQQRDGMAGCCGIGSYGGRGIETGVQFWEQDSGTLGDISCKVQLPPS